jgi:hypothetical protein
MMRSSDEIPGMLEAATLRTRGKRMLELATRAYCEHHYDFARLLTRLAAEVFARAKDVEESYAPRAIPVGASGRPVRHRR